MNSSASSSRTTSAPDSFFTAGLEQADPDIAAAIRRDDRKGTRQTGRTRRTGQTGKLRDLLLSFVCLTFLEFHANDIHQL